MELEIDQIKNRISNYFLFLKSKRVIFLVFFILFLAVGFFYAYFKKPKYEANLSFIINENDKGIGGSLLSLAGQSGLLLGGGGLTPNDDKILFLFSSKKIIGDAILKKYNSENGERIIVNELIEELNLKSTWASDTSMEGFDGVKGGDISRLNRQESKAVDDVIFNLLNYKLISFESLKKKSLVGQSTGIIFLQVVLKNELLSKALAEEIYESLSSFYVLNSIQKQQSNVLLLERKVDSLQGLIRDTESKLGYESDYNFNTFKASGKVNEYRLKRDLEMFNTIFAEVMKNYELAKLTLEQQKPFFKVIDSPTLPLKLIYKSKLKYSLLAAFGVTLGLLFVFSFLYFKGKNDYKNKN